MVQIRSLLSGMSIIAVLIFMALLVTLLARQASHAISLVGSQLAPSIDVECSYGLLAVCLVWNATDSGPLDDDGDVWFDFDDDVGMGFYRVVPERY
jgi:hypothetical protein